MTMTSCANLASSSGEPRVTEVISYIKTVVSVVFLFTCKS